jgi:hypothetical protein
LVLINKKLRSAKEYANLSIWLKRRKKTEHQQCVFLIDKSKVSAMII